MNGRISKIFYMNLEKFQVGKTHCHVLKRTMIRPAGSIVVRVLDLLLLFQGWFSFRSQKTLQE